MRYRLLIGVSAIVLGLTYAVVCAQNRSLGVSEGQAIGKATDAYVKAFNKGDLDGVLAIWADDAESIDEAGKVTKGRKALAAMFKKSLHENKGLKVQIKIAGLQFLKEDVAMQDGSVLLTHASGETGSYPFSAVWIKKDGQWRLARVRDLPSQSAAAAEGPDARLKDLGWLVGEWTHEDKDKKTTLVGHWMKGHNFLVLDYVVQAKGDEVLSLTQIVGFNPLTEKLHSWVFDARGGLGEGSWSRNNETWTVACAGVTADGRHATGTHQWTHVDDNAFVFQSLDREIDGQPLPDVKISYTRTKTSK